MDINLSTMSNYCHGCLNEHKIITYDRIHNPALTQVYIASSKANQNDDLYFFDSIKKSLINFNLTPYIAVLNLDSSKPNQELLNEAFSEINKSCILIAEGSHESIGVGIEIGYAKALRLKIIYTRKELVRKSKTLSGTADFSLEYDKNNLENQITEVIKSFY